jgi:hypothetical protein
MYVVVGVVGLLGLLLVMATAMTAAARLTARVVGVGEFRWFDERPARAAWWRWAAVRLVSALAPLGVSIALFWGSMLAGGAPESDPSPRVEVVDGPARDAGMRDGDRILRIGGEPIADWDQLRAAVKRHTGATAIEVERDGQSRVLTVTPRSGRIAVQPTMVNRRLGVVESARRAVAMPFAIVRATLRELSRRANRSELRGPVSIVRETSKAGQTSGSAYFFLLAVLAGYLWPFAAGLTLFDAVTGYIFRATHPDAATTPRRGYRLDRLRQAALFVSAGYATFLATALLVGAGVSLAAGLLLWAMLAATAGYPLLWNGGKELWGRPLSALVVVAAIFMPCVLLFGVLWLHHGLGRALRKEGFDVTWLRAQPAAQSFEAGRWPSA